MYSYRVPKILQKTYPSLLWNYSRRSKKVYFTFDDGPNPNTTPQLLDLLKQHNVKATFFCVGENVEKYPDLYQRIIDEGHVVGNHSFNHLNGFKTKSKEYFSNVQKASELIDSKLYRPPYGKVKRTQITKLKKNYKVVMWSLLIGDWDHSHTKEQCFFVLKNRLKEGDIVVLHDSEKAFERMMFTVEKGIEWAREKGYELDVIQS